MCLPPPNPCSQQESPHEALLAVALPVPPAFDAEAAGLDGSSSEEEEQLEEEQLEEEQQEEEREKEGKRRRTAPDSEPPPPGSAEAEAAAAAAAQERVMRAFLPVVKNLVERKAAAAMKSQETEVAKVRADGQHGLGVVGACTRAAGQREPMRLPPNERVSRSSIQGHPSHTAPVGLCHARLCRRTCTA